MAEPLLLALVPLLLVLVPLFTLVLAPVFVAVAVEPELSSVVVAADEGEDGIWPAKNWILAPVL